MKILANIGAIGLGAVIAAIILRELEGPGIGKIYDTYPIKPGGRVDMAWLRQTITDRKFLGASRPAMIKYGDPEEVVKDFRLHSIEYGNWMSQEDRANFTMAAGASLYDMAKVFGVAHGKMGFNKTLSVALGARGSGGAVAHYERTFHVINQTKPGGMNGSFGHEYGHAMDAVLGRKAKVDGFASGGRSTRKDLDRNALAANKKSIPYQMERVFQILFYTESGEYTAYARQLKDMPEYWNRRTEIWARTIERYLMIKLHNAGITNKFLVKGAPNSSHTGMPPMGLVEKAMPFISQLINRSYT